MSLLTDIIDKLPDNTTGQITPLKMREIFTLLVPEVEKSIKSDGSVQMDVDYVASAEQDVLTKKFQDTQTRGFIAETNASSLAAEGAFVEVIVPFDGEAGRKFMFYAEVYFDSSINVNGEVQYEFVMKDNLNVVTETISRSKVEWDQQLSSSGRTYEFIKFRENSNVGGTAIFRFRLMGEWHTPVNIQCDFSVYDMGAV